MKKIRLHFLLFLLLIFFTSCLTIKNDNKKQDKVLLTAQKELSQTLNKIPIGQEELYGFNNRSEIENAGIGKPFEFYMLNDDELKPTSSYRAPVIVADEFRALATVEILNDTLHIVDFGATTLAKEIQTVCKENSKMNFVGILRIYSAFSDFVIMSKKQNYLFIPLTSAKIYLKTIGISNPENYYSKNQIVSFIKTK
jgi:hypothetical protein